jgi:F-type H+-transporting ATPase subunit a
LLRTAAKGYANRKGMAPKGIQSFMEPVILYIRDEVAIPFIGEKRYEGFLPLLLSIFFFILGLNLWGQVPFLGGTNVTGSLTVTMVLAILVFLISNFNGNKHYWQHLFWMPGVPVMVKPLLAIIEIMSLFIKPLTLMLRLAGNITAGHIAILSFIGLIFIFGESGHNMTGGIIGAVLSTLLTLFMMAIELIVAFIQAYVFTLLSASYIGAAVEEHEHH